MDGVTQQNAALVDQARKATDGLDENVRKFKQALNVFKLKRGASASKPRKERQPSGKKKVLDAA